MEKSLNKRKIKKKEIKFLLRAINWLKEEFKQRKKILIDKGAITVPAHI
jgi:hypothetical protein